MDTDPRSTSARPFPHRFPHRGLLPEGRYYTLTWGIGYDFGGMTTVALERSSAFARLDNRRVDILTLSPELKGQERELELRDEGRIDRRVKVQNLWQDLTTWSDRKLRRMIGTEEADPRSTADVLQRTGQDWSEFRRDSEKRLLQVDRYHDRGHLLVVDRQDMKKRGRRGGRRITLFDREQKAIAQWSTAREFYQAWLDVVIGTRKTFLICDSAFVGNFVHEYRRDNVMLCQVVHSHHLDGAGDGVHRTLAEGKFGLLSNLDAFDLVTTLTDEQRRDMDELRLTTDKLRTVPNFTDDLHGDPTLLRPRGRGAMIARLVPEKRVEDAITAIAHVRADNPDVTLDVYGEGEDRPMLTDLIDESGVTGDIRLHGHTTGAKSKFHTSSFSLLTSRFEGLPLVVLESMSAGCIPICYAMDYGPADIIEHGVNGFTVRPGDVDALTETILQFLSMSDDEVRTMRQRAIERAADFSETAIVQRWGQVLAEQSFTPIVHLDELHAQLRGAEAAATGIQLDVDISGLGSFVPEAAYVSWKSRAGCFYGRVAASCRNRLLTVTLPAAGFPDGVDGYLDFSVDLIDGRSFNRARIAGADDAIANQAGRMELYTTKHGNLSARMAHRPVDVTGGSADLTSTSSS
ncbi:glycosyltransferase [Brevibacterium renqingii]|uniref:glycosyltransferase n=1 Tax=Brevibacterium renqingii TaxID=2776916 RepID=UPI001AE03EF6|nr:glycosyltransferase [Brevibacterium renqingii]